MHAMTALIAGLGVTVLAGLSFAATPQSSRVALIVPPWAGDGVALAAATGLAIVDSHWRHHVIILDTGGDPAALPRLQAQGLWLLDASGAGFCQNLPKET